jgi:hypothetical protein
MYHFMSNNISYLENMLTWRPQLEEEENEFSDRTNNEMSIFSNFEHVSFHVE